jgi:hypothetical protein
LIIFNCLKLEEFEVNIDLALAKKYDIMAKANEINTNFIPPAKAGGN